MKLEKSVLMIYVKVCRSKQILEEKYENIIKKLKLDKSYVARK